MDFEQWIGEVRQALSPVPRSFSPEVMRYITPPEPAWLQANPADLLWGQYYHHELLFVHGSVCWAVVQQANAALFEAGEHGASPGVFLFSPDAYYDGRPEALHDLAVTLAAYKHEPTGDPDLAAYGARLAAESERHGKRPLPPKLVEGREVYAVDAVVHREHLPVPFLAGSILPVVHQPSTNHIWIVPAGYWPDELVAAWSSL
jgi:hypothetical protein